MSSIPASQEDYCHFLQMLAEVEMMSQMRDSHAFCKKKKKKNNNNNLNKWVNKSTNEQINNIYIYILYIYMYKWFMFMFLLV